MPCLGSQGNGSHNSAAVSSSTHSSTNTQPGTEAENDHSLTQGYPAAPNSHSTGVRPLPCRKSQQMAQIPLMTRLQCSVGGHRPAMPEAQAMEILVHLLWLLVLLPLQCPAMLRGATHPPAFICLAVFPLKMRFGICQEATITKFFSRSKEKR